jgi:DNA-binding transcriptional MerR regulator
VQIGQVAERTELSVRTVRHYDEVGLVVPSARSAGGFRLYTEDDVAQLLLVRRMKPLGFTLEEMRLLLDAVAVLEGRPDGDTPTTPDAARTLVTGFRDRARARCDELRTELARAEELAERLAAQVR